ncbi:RNA methyltransferase [Fulvivirga sp. RKSG066]|uniref:TrmH family RNA methyltransferase n=1 Tax=Fulvivirga aurantia TaxID=2529383 RepID=UPI0012BCD05E|nr:RNA methyltransferase [Fulvivirga aurantia]MTI23210.1 RNA methyltransferase [Fulvivirga aurantia]
MLTKATAKFIKSLQLKKYRKQEELFVVEGEKSVLEAITSDFTVELLVGTEEFYQRHEIDSTTFNIEKVSKKELAAIGSFKTNDGALAVLHQKPNTWLEVDNELALVLDDINDPGNLGTIIRIADWYGIDKIIASTKTVDLYNPKVIAASKGSFLRVNTFYTNLEEYLKKSSLVKYTAMMDGNNIHTAELSQTGLIIMGNEANGVSEEVLKHADHKISIPRFGGAESLNVAMATAIICDNFRRK